MTGVLRANGSNWILGRKSSGDNCAAVFLKKSNKYTTFLYILHQYALKIEVQID